MNILCLKSLSVYRKLIPIAHLSVCRDSLFHGSRIPPSSDDGSGSKTNSCLTAWLPAVCRGARTCTYTELEETQRWPRSFKTGQSRAPEEGRDGLLAPRPLRYRDEAADTAQASCHPFPLAILPVMQERSGWMFKECKLMLMFEY